MSVKAELEVRLMFVISLTNPCTQECVIFVHTYWIRAKIGFFHCNCPHHFLSTERMCNIKQLQTF